jgi:Chaperone of endosialidase
LQTTPHLQQHKSKIKHMKKFIFLYAVMTSALLSNAQSIGIGTTTPNASAQLDVTSTTRGFLPPRMTAAQRTAIVSPADGLIVYDSDSAALMIRSTGVWRRLAASASQWISNGQNIYYNAGDVGIGTSNPSYKLSIEHGGQSGILVKSTSGFSAIDIDGFSGDAALRFFSKGVPKWNVRSAPGTGNFEINSFGDTASFGGNIFTIQRTTGNVGIGVDTPNAKLSVAGSLFLSGNIKIADGTQGANKVLTSDATGVASWQNLPSTPSQFWTANGNNIQNNNSGNVGIGISFPPESKLVVAGNAAFGIATSSGVNAFATGYFNSASGSNSFASGSYSIASGADAAAIGSFCDVAGASSAAFGYSVKINGPSSFGIGSYNSIEDTATAYINKRVFQVGIGSANNDRRNAFTILRNGNIGIGTLNPNNKLSVSGSANIDDANANTGSVANTLTFGNNSGEGIGSKRNAGGNVFGLDFYTGSVNRLSITNSGNVGIGVSDPAFRLDVGARMRLRATPGVSSGIWLNNEANTVSTAFIGMRFDDEVGFFGQTGTPGWRFSVNTTTGNAALAGSLIQNSDARLKTNIIPLNNTLSIINKLSGYKYYWKDAHRDSTEQIGLLAQEIQQVLPQLVKTDDNGILSVNYSGMVPVLLQAIKEQNAKMEQQQAMIEKQQQQINELLLMIKAKPVKQ